MKQMKLCAVAALLVWTATSGCKKEGGDNNFSDPPQSSIIKAKTWFANENNKSGESGRKATTASLEFSGDNPQWNETRYFETARTLVTPVVLDNHNKSSAGKVAKFLVMQEDQEGQIEEGYYVYLLSKGAGPQLTPALLSRKDIPGGFTGALIRYSIDGRLLSADHYENGEPAAKYDKISNRQNDGTVPTQNSMPNCEPDQTSCIDWYWQTYQNGILIYEEYLYTTCHCEGTNTGGGGTGTGTSGPCGLNCEQVQQLMDNISITTSHEVTGHGGAEYTGPSGIIRMAWVHNWQFLTLNLFPGYSPKYTAYLNAGLYRANAAATKWKYETFVYSSFSQTGGTIPTCFTVALSISVATTISTDQYTASANLSGTAETTIPCLNSIVAGRHNINNLPQTFTPPPVLLGND